ncbi:hypothetical protein DICPUDRAFT_82649 [Dictyostelium purpureum]|uniref:Uncharacterized protein n=1 Tax=Dictyostelium purpureum TaxID=5786 RepID=F0ZX57_DICPU|nr:uncharacterized protein DICPUDRAFT_82649 [Dictyostelium purpureum]EGC31462.1 hypothetical protein DICPUDRAFT_82649 [Dictyostelium purpureum]|eukprot:XP_003292001.1 hypothetical protein DICPUDRAFT_82649 [Dictyostelium purpureum]
METFEIIFWKVYRNLFINKKIFYHLLNDDIEYKNYEQYHFSNRISFINIKSFKWMIDNNKIELLKDKIHTNQEIDFEGSYHIIYTSWEKKIEEYRIIFKSLFDSNSKYKNQNKIDDLIKAVLYMGDAELLEIVLNQNGQFVNNDHLHLAISKFSNRATEIILNVLENQKKEKLNIEKFKIISKDLEKFKLVLNTPSLLNQCDFNHINKYYKQLNYIDPNYIEVYNKLLDMNYYIGDSCLGYLANKFPFNRVEEVLLFFKIYYKFSFQSDIPQEIVTSINEILNDDQEKGKEKKLFKLLVQVSTSKKLYSIYYFKYYEIIEVLPSTIFINLKTNNILKTIDKLIENDDKDEIIKFLHSFFKEIKWSNWNKNYVLANKIIFIIYTVMNTKEWYDKAMSPLYSFIGDKLKIPLEWSCHYQEIMGPCNSVIIIKDGDIINTVSKISRSVHRFNNLAKFYIEKKKKKLIIFQNNQLETYAMLKIDSCYKTCPNKIEPIKWSQILNNPLSSVLSQLKWDEAIIDEEFQNENNENTYDLIYGFLKKYSMQDNQLRFEFHSVLIKHFARQLEKKYKQGTNKIIDNIIISISNTKIREVLQLLVHSIIEFDLYTTKIILNSIDLNEQFLEKINDLWKCGNIGLYSKNNKIKKFFKFKIFKKHKEINTIYHIDHKLATDYIIFWVNRVSNSSMPVFTNILNYLYKRYIQIYGITLYEIKRVKQLIDRSNIILEHSVYHSFYYILAKSHQMIKYIVDTIMTIGFHNDLGGKCLCHRKGTKKPIESFVKDFIDQDVFTIDYLTGPDFNSGDCVELLLLYFNNKAKEILGYNYKEVFLLNYYIIIDRFDLLFNFLGSNAANKFSFESVRNKIKLKVKLNPNNVKYINALKGFENMESSFKFK